LLEQARRQINRLAEEIARLSEMDLAPADYYGEFLQRVLTALAAPAGAIWLRTQQGNLQLQYQINMRQVGLDKDQAGRESHDELLRQAMMKGQPGLLAPHSGLGQPEGGKGPAAGNPTDFVVLLAPIMVDKNVAGLVEVWQDPNRGAEAQRGFLQFLIRMAGLASGYTRNHQLRTMTGQQQVWTQLETFARQIHASLNPTEVAYLVANEGRRLLECDRLSVGQRIGSAVKVEAISGADVVEKRSNLVQLMRALMWEVLKWGEKLTYSGTRDETLPPGVNHALDAYLAESNSKMLVVLPLRDEREPDVKRPSRSVLLLESFDPQTSVDQAVAKLEVVGKHITPALYNAAEHRRIPMRFLWVPLAHLQEGLGGKTKAIIALVLAGLVVLIGALVVVPYPLRMEANGELLPKERVYIFSPGPGQIKGFPAKIKSGAEVNKGDPLVLMYSADLAREIIESKSIIATAKAKAAQFSVVPPNESQGAKFTRLTQLMEAQTTDFFESKKLEEKRLLYNADLDRPGEFVLLAPMKGIVLSSDFREKLTGTNVNPAQPILRIGAVSDPKNPKRGEWEIELKIPQKHLGQVLLAYKSKTNDPNEELDVDILLTTNPTATYKGKLARGKIASEANPNRDANNEAEPMALAWVRISPRKDKDGNNDIPTDNLVPTHLLLTGTEVHSRIRCGDRPMGYSLFYGVWEFFYERVVFFF
jgi:hypothetical protein